MTKTQSCYSTVELECLALVFAISKLDYYLRYSNLIKVYTDSKNLCDYWNMSLPDIKNSRISKMIEKLHPYSIQMEHVRGETHFLPDYLSRNPKEGRQEAPEISTFTNPSICNRSFRLLTSEVDVKDYYVQQVAEEASKDSDYTYIIQAVKE